MTANSKFVKLKDELYRVENSMGHCLNAWNVLKQISYLFPLRRQITFHRKYQKHQSGYGMLIVGGGTVRVEELMGHLRFKEFSTFHLCWKRCKWCHPRLLVQSYQTDITKRYLWY